MLELDISCDPEAGGIAFEMVAIRHAINQLELKFSSLSAQLARTDYWDHQGANSATEWIRFNCQLTGPEASKRLRVKEQLAKIRASVQAMTSGEIGFGHLSVMAQTAGAVGEVFDEHALLDMARENSPGKFFFQCLHYRHAIDAKGYARNQENLYAERRLHLTPCDDGCVLIHGVLDPVGGAALQSALEPLAKPSGAHDYRLRPQRLHDALIERVTHGGKQKVAMNVTASIETLLDLVGAPGAENEFSLPISSKTVERWACDCNLTRVLLQDSVVIDVGRAERTIKGPRRRALMARDKHCQWPGCDRPASWCDAHHIKHWLHGGSGELENQLLLCGRHHRLVHEGGWQIVKTDDGQVMPVALLTRFAWARGPD